MKDLEQLHREAPQLETPASLDDSIMRAARSRLPVKARAPSSRWRVAGYAVSYLCVFGIGLGTLLKSGFIPIDHGTYQPGDEVSTDLASVNETARKVIRQSVPESGSSAGNSSAGIAADSQLVAPQQQSNSQLRAAADKLFIEEGSDAPMHGGITSDQVIVKSTETAELVELDEQDFALSNSAESSVRESESETVGESIRQKTVADSVASASSIAPSALAPSIRANRRSGDWLLMQNAELYTIQIAQSDTADSLLVLAQQVSMTSELVELGTETWVLMIGSFKNKDAATQAMNELLQSSPSLVVVNSGIITPQIVTFKDLQRRVK